MGKMDLISYSDIFQLRRMHEDGCERERAAKLLRLKLLMETNKSTIFSEKMENIYDIPIEIFYIYVCVSV